MRKLILIKHARPFIDPASSPSQWQLSPEGLRKCQQLAEAIKHYAPVALFHSRERKARETAETIAPLLNLQPLERDGLEEHHRETVPHLATREFLSLMAIVIKQPQRKVIGEETAAKALARFEQAISTILTDHPDGNLAVVSHGTVISLFAADRAGLDGYKLWRAMAFPAYLVFDLPTFELVEQKLAMPEQAIGD